ncbi:MAG: hypothetical protein A3J07_05030 [Candidatus Doudnabacteria bacterium RIFCSPLOWO2_02_FULL_49_13]|uniref:Type II secretion system protein J n=1 Tax=Candidatus Doudnabacteria bacterium RIFCSPHIGHO2_12_FULL_48_16 TaxID=1817838 RepID=A0A1F5PKQ8_9BACT|nr:MAG: hypothetical protein A3B77_04670 [Candidatus Doudnabacteria bacterium RIFCSPHIGHO2_02_FULL_49_24]OGE88182.1 MAG: hypothetical protein A2760_02320 [Candidatus Doudnabacteria bacterium RIFCSPHIGHO2_01_FULL_50_67]OGE90491.1 MAG: hypothetical protein A3E29_05100 [Candidatus Doudnabacteria bacterium RIFCSPHIGHO2_12_FULL_48_16]OGE96553.1 MAG: hypothetical protein A2990_03545 [Candidatus Doudnabacteria bacterium RIFCSPLOWO2_01_FULL_49_40]OGF02675.1 MAG: hypothetical protein A3H14_03370 [Candid
MKSQKGFTLIESVVATAVFAFVVSSILGVYVATTQLDRKSRASRAVTQNARFILEYLAKEVRNGNIDYASYPGGNAAGTADLYVEDQANLIEHFYLSGTNLILDKNGAVTNLNSAAVEVTKLQFLVAPVGDPYTIAKTHNEQPHVTVVLELTSNYGQQEASTIKLNLQGTFTTRGYLSRQP